MKIRKVNIKQEKQMNQYQSDWINYNVFLNLII